MKVLLVGATGFLGSYVAPRLVERGHDVVALVRSSSARGALPANLPVIHGDLADTASLDRALGGKEALVYCASMGFGHVPPVVESLKRARVRRGVWVSTTAIFTSLPAASRAIRLAAEQAVKSSGLDWTIARPTMIYGTARDRNVSRLLRFLSRSPLFPVVGDGGALHQPVHVEDLADALVATLDGEASVGRAYNLAGAAPLPFRDLVSRSARALGRDVRLLPVPMNLALGAAAVAAALPLPRPVTPEQIRRLAEDKAFDWSEAARDLGFQPRTFETGVRSEARLLGLAPL